MSILEVQIKSLRGVALAEPRMARFDVSGGTMGRAVSNTLVLDDPERTVSRVHAQVLCRNGQLSSWIGAATLCTTMEVH